MISPLVLLLLLDIEALAALLWAAFTPSEAGQGVFLWFSGARLALLLVLFGLLAGLLWATFRLWRSQDAAFALDRRLNTWLVDQRWLAGTLIWLGVWPALIVIAAGTVLRTPLSYSSYGAWAPDRFPLLHAVVHALLPLLALVAIGCLQTAIALAVRFREALFQARTWAWEHVAPALLLLLISSTTVFHWLVLIFQLRFFVNIPGWYWIFDPVRFGAGDLWFALVALALMGLSYWLLVLRNRPMPGLLATAALGLFLQYGVGLMGGGGMTSLRDRYFTTHHRSYILRASSSNLSLLDTVHQYEQAYGTGAFTGTKPPGLMVFYTALDHITNGFPSAYDDAARYRRLSDTVVWLFPVLAVSVVGLLFAFARRLLEDPSTLIQRTAPLLFALAPSLALFTFFADQAVYPAVFLLGIWITVTAIRRQSLLWAFVLGLVIYLAVFFAFTMLPLYVFAGLYLTLFHWRMGSRGRVERILLHGLAIASGTLLMYMLGRALLNYDFVPRFQRAMTVNHNFDFYLRVGLQPTGEPESFPVRLGQIVRAAWINNLDFATGVGFPIYVLFLVQALRRLWRFPKARAGPGDIILLALLTSFLVLNLAGTAQGEVPRLWLFWLPMFALLAAYELEPHLRRRPSLLLALGASQLVTLMLTFHYQDLRM